MSSNQSGIVTWVSSIRTTMANDPGRQLLEDQIQDGFLFLEDYLDSIMAKPKLNPIIELAKTPARRRNASKIIMGGTEAGMKGKPIITMDLEEVESDKENEVPPRTPMNAFHKALLQSKYTDSSQSKEQSKTEVDSNVASKLLLRSPTPMSHPNADTGKGDDNCMEITASSPRLLVAPVPNEKADPPNPFSLSEQADLSRVPPRPELVIDLSVIEEDDETAERSGTSEARQSSGNSVARQQAVEKLSNVNANSPKPYPRKALPAIDMANIMDIDDFTQTMNFSNMPTSVQSPREVVGSVSYAGSTKAPGSSDRTSGVKSQPSVSLDPDYSTAPLSSDTQLNKESLGDQQTETLTAEEPTSKYPTIGPPSPLRKSIRTHREASSATFSLARQTSTRSSWLVKTREARTAEDSTKKLTYVPTVSHNMSAGSKRKSRDMLGTERDTTQGGDVGRTQKLTKTAETSSTLDRPEGQEKQASDHFRDEAIASVDDRVDDSDGMINKLKKTVAGFSARTGKSMGKSLGGAAASALAEARAAAEAKVAERNAAEGRIAPAPTTVVSHESPGSDHQAASTPLRLSATSKTPEGHTAEKGHRLSVSDLVSKPEEKDTRPVERVFQPPPRQLRTGLGTANSSNITAVNRTSTTPPMSPPKPRSPIFTLPSEKPKVLSGQTFFPPPTTHALPRLELQSLVPRIPQPIPTHSTLFPSQSTYPDSVFDYGAAGWLPSTQDTDFSDHFISQLPRGSHEDRTEPGTGTDADESWHLDEKFGETWTPIMIGMKDDSMTWSTAPTRSTRSADTGPLDASEPPVPSEPSPTQYMSDAKDAVFEAIPSDNPPCTDEFDEEEDMDVELNEDFASVRLVTPASKPKEAHVATMSAGQPPLQETQSSLDNVSGFFSSATKLVSSVLGGNKKGKEPVKSLQLAAAAAKKQQEEAEKKANRLKEFEARRQQVLRKKAEEDKTREEKKARDELERRKREKEDVAEKRIFKQPGKKLAQIEDEAAKKRKATEGEKMTEPKKPQVKDKKDIPPSKIGKFALASSQTGMGFSHASKIGKPVATTQDATKSASAQEEAKSGDAGKPKEKAKQADAALEQPSRFVRSQMQARYQAELHDSRKAQAPPAPVSTESIELPDINSEYSDSDDENRFDPPGWAQSPELREALQSQSTVNPDDIFGAIRPLKMEELFKNRTSRFRARTSSAVWAGTDELTAHEEREYARRMGYTS